MIAELAQVCNTMSPQSQEHLQYVQAHPNWWDWFVRSQIESFAAYFDTLLELSKSGQVYFVRYEDLLNKREVEVT